MNGPAGLTVVALGGNALSAPHGGGVYGDERAAVADTATELAHLALEGDRLLVVHGNGTQVGRLLAAPGLGDEEALDIHVAQTQGELGYLITHALEDALVRSGAESERVTIAMMTRVIVDGSDPAFAEASKPIGPVLAERPKDVPAVRLPGGKGWRRVVASPRPQAIVEMDAIADLLEAFHVVAGGGGGVPVLRDAQRRHHPVVAVVDKDWVALLLATALGARRLLFVTDVPHAADDFGGPAERRIARMTPEEAFERLERGVFAPGSMAPKVAAAADFVAITGGPAWITTIGAMQAALSGDAGTAIMRGM